METTRIMYWSGVYMTTGFVTLLLVRFLLSFKTSLPSFGSLLREIRQELEGEGSRRVRWTRFAEKVLMFPLVLLIWPLVIWIVFQDQFLSPKNNWKPDPEDAFHCHRKHLIRVVSPDAAQVEAKVVDPLGRMPDLPFGHLNAGWHDLLADRQIGDTLWYFEIPGCTPEPETAPQRHQWSVPRGAKRGYALVQSSKVRKEFVFEWD